MERHNLNCMMRKTTLQYEFCKFMLTANVFVNYYKTLDKRNSSVLYRDNVHADIAGLLRPRKQVTQLSAHKCSMLSLELSNKGYQTYQRVEHE